MKHGNILKRMRKSGNLSQRDISRKLSLDVSHLCRCENDKQPYPVGEDLIIRYAEVLNLDPWPWLFEAKRFPSEMAAKILNDPGMFDFLTVACKIQNQLPASFWEKLIEEIKKDSP